MTSRASSRSATAAPTPVLLSRGVQNAVVSLQLTLTGPLVGLSGSALLPWPWPHGIPVVPPSIVPGNPTTAVARVGAPGTRWQLEPFLSAASKEDVSGGLFDWTDRSSQRGVEVELREYASASGLGS